MKLVISYVQITKIDLSNFLQRYCKNCTIFLGSPMEKLAALKACIEEEVNSVNASLRNTFMNKIPTPEDIRQTCSTLASRLILDESSRTECKLALVDLLDEALQGKFCFVLSVSGTLGDLTQNFPTFSNLILNLSSYTKVDLKSTYMSNI